MTHLNVDSDEIAKFNELSLQWWDPQGAFKSLHDVNPIRLDYINTKAPIKNQNILDIGCGGGILSESMAKLGAKVTAIDMSETALRVAQLHQQESGTNVEYLNKTAEQLAEERPHQFDIVTCLEMLEHVPDPYAVIQATSRLIKPQGHIFFSTLNRNVKSYLYAIIGAEYILKLLPKNTHDFSKFIRPSELAEWVRQAGLAICDMKGIAYNVFTKEYALTTNCSVNYLVHVQ